MNSGALTLQSRSEQIEWIHGTRAKCPTERANTGRGEIAECNLVLIAVFESRFSPGDDLLEVLVGGEVNGTIREHANETHWKTAVEGANATGSPHLTSSGEDQGIAAKPTFGSLILHTAGAWLVSGLTLGYGCSLGLQFQSVQGIYTESGSR